MIIDCLSAHFYNNNSGVTDAGYFFNKLLLLSECRDNMDSFIQNAVFRVDLQYIKAFCHV